MLGNRTKAGRFVLLSKLDDRMIDAFDLSGRNQCGAVGSSCRCETESDRIRLEDQFVFSMRISSSKSEFVLNRHGHGWYRTGETPTFPSTELPSAWTENTQPLRDATDSYGNRPGRKRLTSWGMRDRIERDIRRQFLRDQVRIDANTGRKRLVSILIRQDHWLLRLGRD